MSAVRSWFRGSRRRNVAVLVWTPVLLLGPVLDLHGSTPSIVFQVAMILVMAASAVTAALVGGPPWRDVLAPLALSTLAAATFAGATHADAPLAPDLAAAGERPAEPCSVRAAPAVPATTAASMWAAWAVLRTTPGRVLTRASWCCSPGLANAAFTALLDTISGCAGPVGSCRGSRWRRSGTVLAGPPRPARSHAFGDGGQGAGRPPAGRVRPGRRGGHATDIEQVGRRALVDVRQAVDAMRAPAAGRGARRRRRAFDAAGIDHVDRSRVGVTDGADELLAWVVRESTTNVLRHSGASTCRISLTDTDGRIALTVVDDGVGAVTAPTSRRGGLEGLRERLAAGDGDSR